MTSKKQGKYICEYTFCMLGKFSSADFKNLSKISFWNTTRVLNSLDLDEDRHCVGPGVGQNCLQSLSADEKCCREQGTS